MRPVHLDLVAEAVAEVEVLGGSGGLSLASNFRIVTLCLR